MLCPINQSRLHVRDYSSSRAGDKSPEVCVTFRIDDKYKPSYKMGDSNHQTKSWWSYLGHMRDELTPCYCITVWKDPSDDGRVLGLLWVNWNDVNCSHYVWWLFPPSIHRKLLIHTATILVFTLTITLGFLGRLPKKETFDLLSNTQQGFPPTLKVWVRFSGVSQTIGRWKSPSSWF